MAVVTRFAPSPTGYMHIGGARTALFAYLWAQKNKGEFILRIEDTDTERKVEGSIEHIQESLAWLGIDWDYGPDKPGPFGSCIQSERLPEYHALAQKLTDRGFAYPDPYAEEEVQKLREKAQAEKRPFLYREHRPESLGKWDGKAPLRFKVPTVKRYRWTDAVRGNLEAGEEALDDFILLKGNGYPTYNFAHIVDDHAMGVTHIFRADEFIASTPRFLSLYEALDFTPPVFVTLPPILGTQGTKKLSKRDGAKDILEYRAEGYLPDAVVNFLALIGWNPGTEREVFARDELIEFFSLDQIQTHGGALNEEKLKWFNREHMLRLPSEEFETSASRFLTEETRSALAKAGRLGKALRAVRERIQTFGEVAGLEKDGEFSYLVKAPTLDIAKLPWQKEPSPEATKKRLEGTLGLLEGLTASAWTADSVKATLWPYAEQEGRGAVLWPLRYALTGRERSPDPFIVADILGHDETLSRIKVALAVIR
jgi:glutamyl-tRNA synthetase